jgi:hypothetical protein
MRAMGLRSSNRSAGGLRLGAALAALALGALVAGCCALPGDCGDTGPDSPDATLDALHAAASRADGGSYFALFTPDAVFIGTDAKERWDLAAFRAYCEPYFARGQGWTYVPTERHVVREDGVAWFDERLHNDKYGETRGSGVLVRRGGRWLIAQYVLSIPVPNELAPDLVERVRALPVRP